MWAGNWPPILKLTAQYLNLIGPDFFYICLSFCVTWLWSLNLAETSGVKSRPLVPHGANFVYLHNRLPTTHEVHVSWCVLFCALSSFGDRKGFQPAKNPCNSNNNNQDDIYGAVIMAQPLREFTRFIWWMQTQRRGGRQPSDQAKPTWTASPPESDGSYRPHPPSPFYYYSAGQPESWYSFYRPTEGGRLSQPRRSLAPMEAAANSGLPGKWPLSVCRE